MCAAENKLEFDIPAPEDEIPGQESTTYLSFKGKNMHSTNAVLQMCLLLISLEEERTQTEQDRQTERQTGREREHRPNKTHKQRDKQRHRETDRQAKIQREREQT